MFSTMNSFNSAVNNTFPINIQLPYTMTISGDYKNLFIQRNCTLTFSTINGSCYYLICSGGGGGGYNSGGNNVGAYGGGVTLSTLTTLTNTPYPVVVGLGGLGNRYVSGSLTQSLIGYNGGESSAFAVSVSGGLGASGNNTNTSFSTVTGGNGTNNNTNYPRQRNPQVNANSYSLGPLISSTTGVGGFYLFGGAGGTRGYGGSNYGGTEPGLKSIPNSGGGGGTGYNNNGALQPSDGGSGIVIVSFLTVGNSFSIL